jgi:UDP-N-acetylglucosamine 2-epimerase (non-hydrolysing)
MYKIAIILGTRPEIIKTWPIVQKADNDPDIECLLIHTGQHYDYEMSQVFFEDLELRAPDAFLEAQGETQGAQTASMLIKIERFLLNQNINVIGVQGDTNSAMAGALAAIKLSIPVAHFEAGCRSYDRRMPEEINRIIIDSISSILFAPSPQAELNLLWEGKPKNRIFMCGNTQKDVLQYILKMNRNKIESQSFKPPYGVVTIHRSENTDNLKRLGDIVKGLKDSPIPLIFPVHPRTRKRFDKLDMDINRVDFPNLELISPMGYLSFIKLLEKAKFVLTDSGGIQEEAAMLNVPCITLRTTSEWPETVINGKNVLVGHNSNLINTAINKLHSNQLFLNKMSSPAQLYEMNAGERILDVLKNLWIEDNLNINPLNMINKGYPLPFLSSAVATKVNHENILYETLQFKDNGMINSSETKSAFKLQFIQQFFEFNSEKKILSN